MRTRGESETEVEATMAAKTSYFYTEVIPFAVMIAVECSNVAQSTLFKAASVKGMSYRVFIVYSYAISAVALAPLAFFFHRKTPIPPFSMSLVGRIVLLGILGFSAQMFGYKGIEYSSPTLSSAISNLTPAITFALALIFRMEKLRISRASSQAKILGTIVSIAGALVVVLYEGPVVIRNSSARTSLNQTLGSSKSDWALGGLFLTADYIILSVWFILQAQTVRMYPAEFLVVLLYSTMVTIISGPVCFLTEPDKSSWKINTEIMWVSLLYAGVIGSSFGTVIHTWGLKVKGPVYVALFRPLSIAIAAIMGVIFLGDSLYLGSVIGAILISVGFYVVIWGKAKEQMIDAQEALESDEAAPLLH